MIRTTTLRLLLAAILMPSAAVMWAAPKASFMPDDDDEEDKTKVTAQGHEFDNVPVDSLYDYYHELDSLRRAEGIVEDDPFTIQLLARPYGDSIALRWAPSEYVPWKYLNGYGYEIWRGCVDEEDWDLDSIAYVRAWNRYKFEEVFAANDTLAGGAVETIFGQGTALNNTRSHPGTAGSIMEVYEEQQNTFGFAMFIAEMRPDLAAAMGLMYVDHDVKPGKKYFYRILPHMADTVLYVSPTDLLLTNVPYTPEPCAIELADSMTSVNSVSLFWPYSTYSAYNIERRKDGESGGWQKVNDKPYISMSIDFSDEEPISVFVDEDLLPGTYHYRLRGLDSFGNWSAPGPEHTVVVPDLVPPAPPVIKLITIHRGDDAITATIDFHKDVFEADLMGYIPFYQMAAATPEGEELPFDETATDSVDISQGWVPLISDRLIAPRDSSVTVDVSGLTTSMVTIAAVDTAMNMTYAMPMPMRIVDLVPPEAPSNLRATVTPGGIVQLVWSPSPSDDVQFYEVFLANDTTHQFMLAPGNQLLRDTMWIDTLSMQVNQAYKYYKVRAVDYTGNNSEFSPVYQCLRPNYTAPTECWADSIWNDGDRVLSRWHLSPEKDIRKYSLYRRLTKEKQWTLVKEYERSEIEGNLFIAIDEPEPEQVQRYYYSMTATNLTGVTTGMSQAIVVFHPGQRIFNVDIKLEGAWRSDNGQTVLGWTIPEDLPLVAPFHFVIERQLEGETFFRPYRSADYDNRTYIDYRLKAGQTTKYRIKILYEDGRSTTYSNEVTVSAKK